MQPGPPQFNPYAPPNAGPGGYPPGHPQAYQGALPPAPRVEGNKLILAKVAPLPAMCVKCGTPANLRGRLQKFAYIPQWTYVLLFLGALPAIIVQAIVTKRASLNLPICNPCNARWTNAMWLLALSILGPLVLGIILCVVGSATEITAIMLIGFIVMIPGFITSLIITQLKVVKPRILRSTFMDDHFVTLEGVAPQMLDMFRR